MIMEVLYYLIPVLLNASIGAWILAKRPTMATNRWFTAVQAYFVIWGLSEVVRYLTDSGATALAVSRISSMCALCLPVCSLYFLAAYDAEVRTRSRGPSRVAAGVLIAVGAALGILVVFTDLVDGGASKRGMAFVVSAGPLYVVHGLWIVGTILFLFLRFMIRGLGEKRRAFRTQYIVIGLSPVLTAVAYVGLEMIPVAAGVEMRLSSYPATLLFSFILGVASSRLGLMSITPEAASRQALDAQPDGVVLIDSEGAARFCNGAFMELTGRGGEGGLCDVSIRESLTGLTEGSEDLFDRPWEDLPDELDFRASLSTVTGDTVPVMATFRKWVDPLGHTPGAILVCRDERPIRKLETEMIHVEKLHSLGTMVSGIAHELNNPLTSIIGFSELGTKKTLPVEQAEGFFRSIHSEARRAHRVIQSLLDFARTSLAVECPVSPNQILKDIVAIRRFDLEAHGVDIEETYDETLPDTLADPRKIRQLFMNVFNNAADAAGEAGGRGRVEVRTLLEEDRLVVKIADNGPGISDKVLPKIFDPFFTTKTVGMGTGLGLSIAHALSVEMGGRIKVETQVREGSTFTVALPVKAVPSDRPKPPSTALFREKLAGKPKVLIVDDEEVLVDMMANFLQFKGCEVDRARDGLVGLEKIEKNPYDLILCDVKMPNLNGREMVKILETKDPDALKKLVICSGDTVSPDTQSFLQASSLRTLNKPFTLNELAKTVKTVLSETYYLAT
ncbi:MAG: ATP-binding protein [Planctomycetota bacterium]|jgi:signal transduction histidine kinase